MVKQAQPLAGNPGTDPSFEPEFERVDLLNRQADLARCADDRRTYALASQALQRAQAIGYRRGVADSLNNLAWCDMQAGALDAALAQVQQVSELAAANDALDPALAKARSLWGLICRRKRELAQALEQMLLGLELARAVGDELLEAGIMNDIGLVYLETEDYVQAREHFAASLACLEAAEASGHARAIPLTNLAWLAMAEDDLDTATQHVSAALVLMREAESQVGEARLLAYLGEIHQRQGAMDDAGQCFERAWTLLAQGDNSEVRCLVLIGLGRYYLAQGDVEQSLTVLEEALDWHLHHGARLRQHVTYELLAQAHEARGDFQQALTYYKRFHEQQARVLREARSARLSTLQVTHEAERVRRERELLAVRNKALQREITQQKALEAEQLERERLRVALEKEHELNAMKTAIMVRIAHEFRTPLSVILTTTQLLTRYVDRLTCDERAEYEQVIRAQVSRLADSLDDILAVLRKTYGQLTFQPVRLRASWALDQALDAYLAEYTPQREVIRQWSVGDRVTLIDQRLFGRILANLLDNAVKFSVGDAPVAVSAHCDDGDLVLVVTNQGIGVPPGECEDIFLPFGRGSNVGERAGVGLGLTIVRDYAALHNGTVDCTVSDGNGTTFTVRLRVCVGDTPGM